MAAINIDAAGDALKDDMGLGEMKRQYNRESARPMKRSSGMIQNDFPQGIS